MALTVLLFIGGGTYLGVSDWNQAAQPPAQTAVVHDLQLLDSNAQILDQLESISERHRAGTSDLHFSAGGRERNL